MTVHCVRSVGLLTCAVIAIAPGFASADTSAAKLNACLAGDPKPCINDGFQAEFASYASMQERCGAKIVAHIDAALVDGYTKKNKGPLADPSAVFDSIGDLCADNVRVGSKQEIAARVKTIHFALIATPPNDSNNVRPLSFKLAGNELAVGLFYEAGNVSLQTLNWVFPNVTYDATVRARVQLYNSCYAGDTDPCLQASLGQIDKPARALREACGAAPAIIVDESVVRALDKSNISAASLIDETLGGLTSVCSRAADKAKFAAVKSVKFTFSSGKPAKGGQGEPTISFARQGDTITVTDYNGTANVNDAAVVWAKKNL
jgi:hypothetical protein